MLETQLLGVFPTPLIEFLLGLNLVGAIALTIILGISFYKNPKKYPLIPVVATMIILWWQLMVIGPLVAMVVLLFLKFRKVNGSVV